MEINGIISAIFIGIVIGVLGRLVVPGRQRIGVLWTIGVGIVAALIGSLLAAGLGVDDTKGVDSIEWLIQIGLAAVGVAALDRAKVATLTHGARHDLMGVDVRGRRAQRGEAEPFQDGAALVGGVDLQIPVAAFGGDAGAVGDQRAVETPAAPAVDGAAAPQTGEPGARDEFHPRRAHRHVPGQRDDGDEFVGA